MCVVKCTVFVAFSLDDSSRTLRMFRIYSVRDANLPSQKMRDRHTQWVYILLPGGAIRLEAEEASFYLKSFDVD